MKNILPIIITVALSLFIGSFIFKGEDKSTSKETAFERVMRTGTIRCGYFINPPVASWDIKQNKPTGPYPEFIEAMGNALGLKIIWESELNLSTYLQDLNNGRFDVECGGGWPNALRGKQVEYGRPLGYFPLDVYVSAQNNSFENNISLLNSNTTRFVAIDGETASLAQKKFFPESSLVSIPGTSNATEPYLMITSNKADAYIAASFDAWGYMQNNPNMIKRINKAPLRYTALNFSVASNEFRLLSMLNTAAQELILDETWESLLQKYKISEELLVRPQTEYKLP